ncbi:MAG: hypothetical protein Q8O57_05945, partial [Kiritimatiellota bacterium]|nr:hypothetical protein [Kiritimatiellota bacterium]
AGRPATYLDATGNTRQFAYDAAGRLVQVRFPAGRETLFSYDPAGNRTGMVDEQGAAQWVYDAMNRVISYTYQGKTLTYGYDANGNRNAIGYPGGKTVRYGFNSLDRLDSVTDWLGRATRYHYDREEQPTEIKNSNGSSVLFETGPTGQLTALRNTLADGSLISTQAFTLDQSGNILLDKGISSLNPQKMAQEKTFVYDQASRLLTAGGTGYQYDDNGSLTKKITATATANYTYDPANRLGEITAGDKTLQYLYDGLDNRIARSENGQRTNYLLDLNNRMSQVLAETDASGNIQKYHVYGLGLINTILPDGETQVYHYDSRGNTVALSNAAGQIIQRYAYDDFGMVSRQWGDRANDFK